ncbi:AraC family transcriptional regulator [Nitrospirillum amazonense]|uniref:AraC family transcriptional regulator n=1 Tax=Nitrospirillum amazonense TaxID=28077 RepID=A0A560ESI9_9PROT|nr:AraC family transcriptional regulator [Nitrospirillum amazonense]TWB12334.1 AraC family transcriptional regulator [Nitrospirillum amazonense]
MLTAQATARSIRSDQLIAAEAGRLLDYIKIALDRDLDAAIQATARLSALLAMKAPGERLLSRRGGLAPWQGLKVKKYIDEHLDRAISTGDLAGLCSLSTSHFCRAFKASFGRTPHAYVIAARIERARVLMLTTSHSLSEIAFACGLADQSHFCRYFRSATGISPGAWRRRYAMDTISHDALAAA